MTTPRMRAADEDRQQAADRLAEHYTAGRLSTQEYDERVARAYAVTYLDEMPALFDDLPGAGHVRGSEGGSPFGTAGFGTSGFGATGLGSGAGRSGAFGGFDPAAFGPAFGPAFARARAAAGARTGGAQGRRGPLGGLPRVAAVALMVLLGFTAVVVIAHIIVPLFVIGLVAFLVTRRRHGGPRNRQGGPRGRSGQQWNGPRQHWAA